MHEGSGGGCGIGRPYSTASGACNPVPALQECRICRAGGLGLVAPCGCKGSMKWVHEHCLLTWMKARWKKGGLQERRSCEVCGEEVSLALTGTDFLLFPYSACTHHGGDPLLISVLVLAVATSTTVFLLCTAMETLGVNLWTSVIRWVITPAILVLKAYLVLIWASGACRKAPAFTRRLMGVFEVIPSLSELLFVSFLNTTRIVFSTLFDDDEVTGSFGPVEYRVVVFVSAVINYAAMGLLLHRAFVSSAGIPTSTVSRKTSRDVEPGT
eukprot:TRINITY_DN45666_c0_g1_i1.p1 TRINITY_DN45666_c0_g1~~TRINITY_DN45666_c0_g1_i1.p1  ORF type:complete len:283 (+),score=47.72 TRINITY_DN45666_c0_g1_i1:44-850(+)